MTSDSPFAPAFSREVFLESLGGAEVLRRLEDGLGAREPFLLVTGDAGVGKTALANEALARWGARVRTAFLAYPALAGAELLEAIIRGFGAEPPDGAGRSKLLACLEGVLTENTSRGQIAMLVVDDAHSLSREMLEELRLLANAAQQMRSPFEVLLIGLPLLEARLDDPALVALRQRISVRARLEPLSVAEIRRYIHHRITATGGDGPSQFARKACRDIAARTGGMPRQINALAAEALRVARAQGDQTVEAEHVQTAAATLGGFAPTVIVEDSADSGPEDAAAPAAHRPTPAKAAAPPTRAVAPKPPGARPPARVALEEVAPTAETPASHDPSAWVARFVGDKGPVQISSQALPEAFRAAQSPRMAEPTRAAEPIAAAEPPLESAAETQGEPGVLMMARGEPLRERRRSRPRLRGGLPLGASAAIAAMVVIATVGLVIRAGRHAQGPAAQGAGAVSTAAAPQAVKDAPSPHRRPGPYTLDVGGYEDLQTALDQRDRMRNLAGLDGWVVAAPDGGGRPYRIVLGIYRNYERATAAANMLLRSRTLHDVTVVPLPPKRARQ